jgi:guanylate kinase
MITLDRKPLLMVVSAPSGAGKTTLCDRLMNEFDSIAYSVSCTTRTPREGEVNGRSYHFMSVDEFQQRVAANEFLEHAVVHGNYYGTLKSSIRDALASGRDVLMDIDVQGAEQIRLFAQHGEDNDWIRDIYVDIFIAPPSMEDLQLRLWGRGKDEEDVIRRRLVRAQDELKCWNQYQYVVVNDRLDDSYHSLRCILLAERQRVRRFSLLHWIPGASRDAEMPHA